MKEYPIPDGIVVAEVTLADKKLGQEDEFKWIVPPKQIAAGLDHLNDIYRERTGEDLPFAKCEGRFRGRIIKSEWDEAKKVDAQPGP